MKYANKTSKIILDNIFYIMIIFAFTGTYIVSLDVGFFNIFPFRILVLFIWFIFLIFFLKNKNIKLKSLFVKKELIFLFIWFGYAVLSLIWVKDISAAIRNIYFLFNGISVIIFSIVFLDEKSKFEKIYKILLFVFFIMTIIGIWEVLSGDHLSVSKYYGTGMNLPSALFNNTNDFSSYLAIFFPFLFSLFRYSKNFFNKLFGIYGIIAILFLILSSGSRANLLAILLQILFIIIFLTNIKGKVKYLLVVGLLLTIIISFNFDIINKANFMLSSIRRQIEDGTGSSYIRLNLILNGLIFLYKSITFGVGAGNIEFYMENNAIYNVSNITNMHNWWAELFTNYGLWIFIGYIWFFIKLLKNTYIINKNNQNKLISEALLLSLIGFVFASISPSSVIAFRPQWIIIGLCLSYVNYYKKTQGFL